MMRITIDANGDIIGELVATAQDAWRDDERLYKVQSTVDLRVKDGEMLGINDLGTVWHDRSDGALSLIDKMLELANERDLVSEEERLSDYLPVEARDD